MRKKLASFYGVGLIACLMLFGCAAPQAGSKNEQTVAAASVVEGRWAVVSRVSDGDTIQLDNGEKVRMIGVNTPETVAPNTPKQPYGEEASAFTKSRLEGKKVFIETDVEEKDRYGRTLAYVFVQEPTSEAEIQEYMFNAILLRDGYAQLMTIQPNVKYQEMFIGLQRAAREANKGLWALGIYKDSSKSTKDVFLPGTTTPTAKQSAEPNKVVVYKSCAEVREAGKAPLRTGDPGYSKQLDRDGDGVACE